MTKEELGHLTCGNTGDVSSWLTLKEQGHSDRTKELFPYCKGFCLYICKYLTFTYFLPSKHSHIVSNVNNIDLITSSLKTLKF